MPYTSEVTVIIPTMAEASRKVQIKKAVASVRRSSNEPITILAIVNGTRFDEEVVSWLERQDDIKVVYCSIPSLPNALHLGRTFVETKFFSTLDDDDEYLPLSTDKKRKILEAEATADIVVGSSQRNFEGEISPHYSSMERVPSAPLIELFNQTWLNSGNALYRTSSIKAQYFEDGMPFAEWTWIAYLLSINGKRVAVLNEICHQINVTAGSLSQSSQHVESYMRLFERMLAVTPPKEVVRLIHKRISAYYHANSMRAIAATNCSDALSWHIKSLLFRDGLRYLTYSRHVVFLIAFTAPLELLKKVIYASGKSA